MERDFDEILKQISYEEWRRAKIQKRHEVLIDPQAAIWNYVDENGRHHNSEKESQSYTSSDEIMQQIENSQNVLFITIKRRKKSVEYSDEWHTFTEKIDLLNNKISLLNEKLLRIHSQQHRRSTDHE